jgi:putative nucleotidyltransferase-like protein
VDFSSPSSYPPPTTDPQRDAKLLADVCGEYVTHTDTGWRNGVASHPDPERLASTADQHGVLPLLARALSLAGIPCETVRARAREIAFRNLALAAELVKLVGALRELGIEALAYKGPVLGQQLYGDVTLRQFRDLDIVIAPRDVMRTRDVLCQLGYKEMEQFSGPLVRNHVSSQCEWQMRGTNSGTIIELHWALFPRYASFDLSVIELNQASVAIEIAGERVRAMNLRHLALVLSAHGTKHFWYRLGWLVDFALVLRSYAVGDVEKILDDAAGKGMKRIFLISAALAANVLRLRLPKAFESAISADDCARVLADNMQQFLFAGMIPEDLLRENVLLLRSRERWSDRVKIVSRLAFTPGPQEWRWVALPQWAEWLYRPIRLARAARYFPRILHRALSSTGSFKRKS